MKTEVFSLAFLLGATCVCVSAEGGSAVERTEALTAAADSKVRWEKILAGVHIGMRRPAVEKVLSRKDAADIVGDAELDAQFKESAHVSLYILDSEWCAAVAFSSAVKTRNNPYVLVGFPNHKVIALPRLLRRTPDLDRKIDSAK